MMGEQTRAADLAEAHVRQFCSEVVPGAAGERVACDPEWSAADLDCFVTVQQRVASAGGACVLGWAIWEWPRVLIEAEFHAVWRSPTGALVDIAMRPFDADAITFVVDPQATYDGKQRDNVRRALHKDPVVRRFIHLQERRFRLFNAGPLAALYGVEFDRALTPRQRREIEQVERDGRRLYRRLLKLK